MKTRLLIIFLKLLSLLPLGLARKIGEVFGSVACLLSAGIVRVTQANLDLCFPDLSDDERKVLVRQSIKHTFMTIFEMGAAWFWPKAKIINRVQEVEGGALLDKAYAEAKGVLILAPHLGNWEFLGVYLGHCDYDEVTHLYQSPKNLELGQLIYDSRTRFGAKMAEANRKGVASLLAALRKGEIVGVLPDQVPPASGGDFSPFFGNQALTMTLVSRLLQKTGAKAVFAFAKRQPGGFKIVFREPDSGLYSEQLDESLLALNSSVEKLVREAAEQYQWEYKRFKRQPEGLPKLY